MSIKERMRAELKIQKQIEGSTPETALLLKVLDCVRWSREWQVLVTTKYHRYGKLSFETHRFHYPSELLVKLEKTLAESPRYPGAPDF